MLWEVGVQHHHQRPTHWAIIVQPCPDGCHALGAVLLWLRGMPDVRRPSGDCLEHPARLAQTSPVRIDDLLKLAYFILLTLSFLAIVPRLEHPGIDRFGNFVLYFFFGPFILFIVVYHL